jgi:C1A family cysteine protease
MRMSRFFKILVILSIALHSNQGYSGEMTPVGSVKAPPSGLANPAAVYCSDLGYSYDILETAEGQVGICTFPEGLSCDAWDFLVGKCGQAHSICAKRGFKVETRSDGNDMYSQEYGVCVTKDGKEIGSVSAFSNLESKSTGGCLKEAPKMTGEESDVDESDVDEDTSETLTALPTSFDWRKQPKGNYLTNIKDQGKCGSCWAFSAVGTTEAALNIAANKVGNNYDLSEQYLVSDCHSFSGYQTCCGGWHDIALNYIRTNGIPDEACMKYVDGGAGLSNNGCSCSDEGVCNSICNYRSGNNCSDKTCSDRCSDWSTRLKKINSTGAVSSDRDTIKSNLINKGPLVASLRMNGSFTNGVYSCSVDSPANHSVVIVGYNDAGQYWIIRNSWGLFWNWGGYFKVGYGECSVEKDVFYATVTETGSGFNSQFNGSTSDWSSVKGAWTNYSSMYYRSTGLSNTGASAKHTGAYGNFTYEVRMKRTGETNLANRIIIRGNPASLGSTNLWKPSYAFQYVNMGLFSVFEMTSTGGTIALKNWTSSEAIVKNGWNTLKVVANGSSLKYYINDKLVWTGADSTLATGQVGFGFYRKTSSGTLDVDWAKLTVITPSSLSSATHNIYEEVFPGYEVPGGDHNQSR